MGIGLLVAGVASYLFFKVGKEALGSDEALQPITSLWVATFALAPGLAAGCLASRLSCRLFATR